MKYSPEVIQSSPGLRCAICNTPTKSIRIHLCRSCWETWCKGAKYRDYPPWLKFVISQSRTERQKDALRSAVEFTTDDVAVQQDYAVAHRAFVDDPSIE